MKKKLMIVVMSICLLVTMIPVTASAQTYSEGQLYWIWSSPELQWENEIISIKDEKNFAIDEIWFEKSKENKGYFAISQGNKKYMPVEVTVIPADCGWNISKTEDLLHCVQVTGNTEKSADINISAQSAGTTYKMDCHIAKTGVSDFGFFSAKEHSAETYLGFSIDYSALKEEKRELYLHAPISLGTPELERLFLGKFQNNQYTQAKEIIDTVEDCGIVGNYQVWKVTIPENFQGNTIWPTGRLSWISASISYPAITRVYEPDAKLYDHMHDNADTCAKCADGKLIWFWDYDGSMKWNEAHTKILSGPNTSFADYGGGTVVEGYFTYFDGEGYVPVQVDASKAEAFHIKAVEGDSNHAYNITFPVGDADGVVTTVINGKQYSIQLQSAFPYCGFFKGSERKEEDYLYDSIDLSKDGRTFYYLAPDREDEGALEDSWFTDLDDNQIDGISIEGPQNNGKGSYYWEITVKDGFVGKVTDETGRGTWLCASGNYSDGDGYEDQIFIYDHKHEGGLEGCAICSKRPSTASLSGTTTCDKPGKEITVNLNMDANPGLASMLLELEYDKDVLEFVSAENGDVFPSESFLAPSTDADDSKVLSWQNSTLKEDIRAIGTLATLTFKIKENAPAGETKINFLCDEARKGAIDVHGNDVAVTSNSAVVNVIAFYYGDVDGNDKVDTADALILRRYLAKWKAYGNIHTDAADLDKDDAVSLRDLTILERHIAGWKGYETIPVTDKILPIA